MMEVTAPIVNGPSEIEDDDSAPSQAGFVSIATRGGLSMARRIVGTAGNVVGW
ncbi:hypothetical protein [Aureimonas sp. ME7]|uniref:hypothetical protein n=1 Tax=Aureimonas sp. ME7 TaxID=2744252 RepID=UPI0015F6F716|nr:hypothetical protein [Aureimonas sp. ME7]